MAGGRPRIAIDWDRVINYCKIHCTEKEIAQLLGISIDTLARAIKRDHKMSFAEFYSLHSAHGKASLRRWQWQAASKGSVTMQMFLGAQWLGQRTEPKEIEDDDPPYVRPESMAVSASEVAAAKAELERRRAILVKRPDEAPDKLTSSTPATPENETSFVVEKTEEANISQTNLPPEETEN